jgi:hypothetical protein
MKLKKSVTHHIKIANGHTWHKITLEVLVDLNRIYGSRLLHHFDFEHHSYYHFIVD